MKFEIEVTDEELRALLQRGVRKVLADVGLVGAQREDVHRLILDALRHVVRDVVKDIVDDTYRNRIAEIVEKQTVEYVRQEIAAKLRVAK